jgi:hypothetical protein
MEENGCEAIAGAGGETTATIVKVETAEGATVIPEPKPEEIQKLMEAWNAIRLMTLEQVGMVLQESEDTVKRHIKAKEMRAYLMSNGNRKKSYRVSREQLESFLRDREINGTGKKRRIGKTFNGAEDLEQKCQAVGQDGRGGGRLGATERE